MNDFRITIYLAMYPNKPFITYDLFPPLPFLFYSSTWTLKVPGVPLSNCMGRQLLNTVNHSLWKSVKYVRLIVC